MEQDDILAEDREVMPQKARENDVKFKYTDNRRQVIGC